ncbi:MAG: hypothetical protein R3E66_08710 [bacterium]
MRIETDIVFRDMDSSDAAKASVEKYVEKIERHHPSVSRVPRRYRTGTQKPIIWQSFTLVWISACPVTTSL